jgi:hypothetical protein
MAKPIVAAMPNDAQAPELRNIQDDPFAVGE